MLKPRGDQEKIAGLLFVHPRALQLRTHDVLRARDRRRACECGLQHGIHTATMTADASVVGKHAVKPWRSPQHDGWRQPVPVIEAVSFRPIIIIVTVDVGRQGAHHTSAAQRAIHGVAPLAQQPRYHVGRALLLRVSYGLEAQTQGGMEIIRARR